jgi:hypothetical protein
MQIFGFFPYKSADRGTELSIEEKATSFSWLFFFPCLIGSRGLSVCRYPVRHPRTPKGAFTCVAMPKTPI